MRTISAVVDIAAAPRQVWTALADLDAYQEWNPFIQSASGQLTEGSRLTLRMVPAHELSNRAINGRRPGSPHRARARPTMTAAASRGGHSRTGRSAGRGGAVRPRMVTASWFLARQAAGAAFLRIARYARRPCRPVARSAAAAARTPPSQLPKAPRRPTRLVTVPPHADRRPSSSA